MTTKTRELKTEKEYADIVKMLIKQAIKDVGAITTEDFYHWLINKYEHGAYKGATWRKYKAALNFTEQPHELLEKINKLKGKRGVERHTPKRIKSISVTKDRILNRLYTFMPEKTARQVKSFIEAGKAVGLRPSEWERAKLYYEGDFGYGKYLEVVNAKQTNGRSHGKTRVIQIEDKEVALVVDTQMELIEMYLAKNRDKTFEDYQEKISRHIRRAKAKLSESDKKACPTLYSARHQFKINAKASGMSSVEIAYLMGHGSVVTAQKEYGRRNAKAGKFGVRIGVKELPEILIESEKKAELKAELTQVKGQQNEI